MVQLTRLSFNGKWIYIDLTEVVAIGPPISVIEFGSHKSDYRVVYLRGGALINVDDTLDNMAHLGTLSEGR